MTEYSVYVEVDTGRGPASITEEFDRLHNELEPYAATVSGNSNGFSAQLTLDAPDPHRAGEAAALAVAKAAAVAGLPFGEIVALEILTASEFERRLAQPTIPDLVSAPEVAEMLQVSRQRVHQLLAENKSFPAPLYRLGAGPLWLRSAVEAFDRRWSRKPGRPRKVSINQPTARKVSTKEPTTRKVRIRQPSARGVVG